MHDTLRICRARLSRLCRAAAAIPIANAISLFVYDRMRLGGFGLWSATWIRPHQRSSALPRSPALVGGGIAHVCTRQARHAMLAEAEASVRIWPWQLPFTLCWLRSPSPRAATAGTQLTRSRSQAAMLNGVRDRPAHLPALDGSRVPRYAPKPAAPASPLTGDLRRPPPSRPRRAPAANAQLSALISLLSMSLYRSARPSSAPGGAEFQ